MARHLLVPQRHDAMVCPLQPPAAFRRTILLSCLLRHRHDSDHDAGMLLAEVPECAR
jgi:hypothetical protein